MHVRIEMDRAQAFVGGRVIHFFLISFFVVVEFNFPLLANIGRGKVMVSILACIMKLNQLILYLATLVSAIPCRQGA